MHSEPIVPTPASILRWHPQHPWAALCVRRSTCCLSTSRCVAQVSTSVAVHPSVARAALARGASRRPWARQSGKAWKDVAERPMRRHGPRPQRQACPTSAGPRHRSASAARAGAAQCEAARAVDMALHTQTVGVGWLGRYVSSQGSSSLDL
jgi:hypothetical protein